MATIPEFSSGQIQAICDILGDTDCGLTGSEIGRLLAQSGIDDPDPTITKRHRLFAALSARQRQDRCGNNVAAFVLVVMEPVRYADDAALFEGRRDALNQVLLLCGYELGEDGKLVRVKQARTLDEAQHRASQLRIHLLMRNVHPEVLRFCVAELVQENYFHAVLEATKSIAERIRELTTLTCDGTALIDQAFGLGAGPRLAFNSLITETQRSEHTGLVHLMKGMFGVFRNPTAHAPKIGWVMTEDDALDLLTMASLLHRRLDNVVRPQSTQ